MILRLSRKGSQRSSWFSATLRLYLVVKGLAIALVFSFHKVGAVLILAGLLKAAPLSLLLVPLGCRELVELYALCGFSYCNRLRRLVLSWISNALIVTPIYIVLLEYLDQTESFLSKSMTLRDTQSALVSPKWATTGQRTLQWVGRLRFAPWKRVTRFLLLWLIGIDVRTLVCSVNFFTRDEELRWIEHLGKRAVPESVIDPQGFGRLLNTGEILLEVAQSFYGLPF